MEVLKTSKTQRHWSFLGLKGKQLIILTLPTGFWKDLLNLRLVLLYVHHFSEFLKKKKNITYRFPAEETHQGLSFHIQVNTVLYWCVLNLAFWNKRDNTPPEPMPNKGFSNNHHEDCNCSCFWQFINSHSKF